MGGRDEGGQVADGTELVRVLQQHAVEGGVGDVHRIRRTDHEVDADGNGARFQQGQGLRENRLAHVEPVRLFLRAGPASMQQGHGLGRRGGLIQQGGVRDLHPRQVHHHGLVVEQHLQATLGDLGLIGRVGRVPARILEDVPKDDRRRDGVGVPESDVARHDAVARGELFELLQEAGFVCGGRQVQVAAQTDGIGDGLADEGVHRVGAQGGEHVAGLIAVGTDVAGGEALAAGQINAHVET